VGESARGVRAGFKGGGGGQPGLAAVLLYHPGKDGQKVLGAVLSQALALLQSLVQMHAGMKRSRPVL